MGQVNLTFEDVCRYAEMIGCEHREGPSKAKDYTQNYFWNPWRRRYLMVLYEAPKRMLRGCVKEEVCWWCIDCDARVSNEAARNLRLMTPAKGLGISKQGCDLMIKTLNNIQGDI